MNKKKRETMERANLHLASVMQNAVYKLIKAAKCSLALEMEGDVHPANVDDSFAFDMVRVALTTFLNHMESEKALCPEGVAIVHGFIKYLREQKVQRSLEITLFDGENYHILSEEDLKDPSKYTKGKINDIT